MKYLDHLGFFMLRRPLYAIEEGNFARRQSQSIKYALRLFYTTKRHAALRLVSEELYHQFEQYLAGRLSEEKSTVFEATLYKYAARMCTRAIPFGQFSGWATGKIQHTPTKISFEEEAWVIHSRLRVGELINWSEKVIQKRTVRKQLSFFVNDTIYLFGKQYRYVEFQYRGGKTLLNISSVSQSLVMDKILDFFSNKNFQLDELRSLLIEYTTAADEIEHFINQLIDSRILLSEFTPHTTGGDFFQTFLQKLKVVSGTSSDIEDLEQVQLLINKGDQSSLNQIAEILESRDIRSSKALLDSDTQLLFSQNSVGETEVNAVIKDLESYAAYYGFFEDKMSDLEFFKSRFLNRYESQWISLLEVMDAESGIGYGMNNPDNALQMPLIQNLDLQNDYDKKLTIRWDQRMSLLREIIRNSELGTNIDLEDHKYLSLITADNNPMYAATQSLMGSFVATDATSGKNQSNKFLLTSFGGTSAGNLIGRFCYADQSLQDNMDDIIQYENEYYKPAVLAEVVHLPSANVGNLVRIPALRKYEIPILTSPGVDRKDVISLSDLYVAVRDGQVRLFSKQLGKEIIPRITHAYNYAKGSIIYKFLADLQYQGVSRFAHWNWSVFSSEPFLPRIKYRSLILSPAIWNIKREDILEKNENKNAFGLAVKQFIDNFRKQYEMPCRVLLVDGDNELLLDLEHPICLDILAQELKKGDVKLKEFLFDKDTWLKDNNGKPYVNEVVIPLKNISKKCPVALLQGPKSTSSQIKRIFTTGSEWLYFKVYVGPKTSDIILAEVINPLAKELLADGLIDQWFYIRYNDPDNHLRVRFHHTSRKDFWQEVISRFQESLDAWIANGLVQKVVMDTYEREVERYGESTMLISEQLFFQDSVAIANFLDLITGEEGEQYRWLFALLNIDMLLDDFGYNLEMKSALLKKLANSFHQETNKNSDDKRLMISLNEKYRKNKLLVSEILNSSKDTEEIKDAVGCFEKRSVKNLLLIDQIRSSIAVGEFEAVIAYLLPSYIHMTLNRMFLVKQRLHETVIYHHLSKYYISAVMCYNQNNQKSVMQNVSR